jgi:hypothetical protein
MRKNRRHHSLNVVTANVTKSTLGMCVSSFVHSEKYVIIMSENYEETS